MLIVDRASVLMPEEAAALDAKGFAGCMVYIGGPAAGPANESWTPERVSEIRAAAPTWSCLPVWVAPTISGSKSFDEGMHQGVQASNAMESFGWHRDRGRVVMLDTERSTYGDHPELVLPFCQGFAKQVYEQGYVAGQYGNPILMEALATMEGPIPAVVVIAHYIRTGGTPAFPVTPPALQAEPSLHYWSHGGRAGWQYWNEVELLHGHAPFDVSTVSMPLDP